MDRYERILALHRTLQAARYPVTVARLQDELGCSRATVYRDLAFLRDALMAPVVGDGEAGFRYDPDGGGRFQLPGLWLNSEELHALLAAQQLLGAAAAGVLSSALAPLQQRIEKLLDEHSTGRIWPMQRVRVIPHRGRRMDEHSFRIVCSAVLERRQLAFDYRAFHRRGDAAHGLAAAHHPLPRQLVPRRLGRGQAGLRSFSVDRIAAAPACSRRPRDVDDAELDRQFAGGYGIFRRTQGLGDHRVQRRAARWVADERWHSQQQGRFLPDGRYELKIPYSNARELLMDVLHYGSDAEIVEPKSLREQMRGMLQLRGRQLRRMSAARDDRVGVGAGAPRRAVGADRGDRGDPGARFADRIGRRQFQRRAGRRRVRGRQARRIPRRHRGAGPRRVPAPAQRSGAGRWRPVPRPSPGRGDARSGRRPGHRKPANPVAVAVDLMRQRVVWLRSDPLWQALRASFAIPACSRRRSCTAAGWSTAACSRRCRSPPRACPTRSG